MKPFHLKRGQDTELLAVTYLESRGLRLIERNYSIPIGEIDIVMQDQDELVFVEVRYRKTDQYGSALETIDKRKQNKLRRTAENYMQRHTDMDFQGCRFDVIGVTGKEIDWVKNAF